MEKITVRVNEDHGILRADISMFTAMPELVE
jgi:hypothetical protein